MAKGSRGRHRHCFSQVFVSFLRYPGFAFYRLRRNPATIMKAVSNWMKKWKTEGTKLYQALPAAMRLN
jgi:hypothetical protein